LLQTFQFMKQAIVIFILLINLPSFSQDNTKTKGLFYKISLATTLGINEDFSLSEEDNKNLIRPSAIFLNNTIGYQFDERSSLGLNTEYNWHSESGLQFFPVHLSFTYNIFDFDDVVFVRGGYGKLLNLGTRFEKGTLYKVGIGYRAYDDNFKNAVLFGLDFSRKRFGFRQTEKLSSVSIFLEFMVF